MKTLLALIFVFVACAELLAADGPAVVLFKVKIEYPELARRHHITGSGVYILNVDPKGNVTSVSVGASTGSPILDGAAIRAFKQFRFKPGTKPRVRVPCSWSLQDTWRQ